MASQAFLKLSSIANSDSISKDEDVFQLLVNSNDEQVIHYFNALKKQHSLPVKHILTRYIEFIDNQNVFPISQKIKLYESIINSLSPPTNFVALPFMKATLNLSKIHESQSNFKSTIELLKTIQMDSLAQEFETSLEFDKFRVQLNTNIAKNSLKIDEIEDAEAYITRISPIIPELSKNPQYSEITTDALKTSIRIMVQLGKWYEASSRLLSLHNHDFDIQIIKYAILAPLNHLKLHLFKKISKSDSILINVNQTPLFEIFNKISSNQLIYYEEYKLALDFLLNTQINDIGREILLSKEYVVESFARSIVESNLISAAEIYENIKLSDFANILKLDQDFVQDVAGEMIRDELLVGLIDDIEKIIEFSASSEENEGLKSWSTHIVESCGLLDKIVDNISSHDLILSESVLSGEYYNR